jgi:hypothetical protein
MINQEELAICERRGHKANLWCGWWAQCEMCGMWLREVTTIEKREDEPPEAEIHPLDRYRLRDKKETSPQPDDSLEKIDKCLEDDPPR